MDSSAGYSVASNEALDMLLIESSAEMSYAPWHTVRCDRDSEHYSPA